MTNYQKRRDEAANEHVARKYDGIELTSEGAVFREITKRDFKSGYDQGHADAMAIHKAAIVLKDLEIKLLKSHYRQGYFDLMKAQLDDPIAAGEKVKEIDSEIQQRLAKG